MKKIRFMDTSFRDGFQSVIGARVITADFIPALEAAVEAGITHMEVGRGARFQSPYFYCQEDAFDSMDLIRKTVGPDINLQTLARGINVVGLSSQPSDIINLHAKLFKKHGITTIRNFDALNDVRNLEYSGRCVYDNGLQHQVVITLMGLPPGVKDPYPHSAKFYCDVLEKILANGLPFHSLCFKDASGTCTPQVIKDAIKRSREILDAAGKKDCPIEMHTHDTAGMSVACYMAALEGGAEIIDLSMRPMSGGTGQPDILTMWHAFKGTQYTLDIDYEKILKAEEVFEDCMSKYMLPPEAKETNPLITLSPMPGGALTANTQMMRDSKCLHLFPEVIKAMREVVERGGSSTSVTPVSQFYFQQAFSNVTQGHWKKITDGYGKMVLGYFGRTPAEPDPEIVKLAAEQLNLQPTTEDPRLLNDKNPALGIKQAEEKLKANNLPVTEENVFILACCEDKGLAFLQGKRPMGVRYKETEAAQKDAATCSGKTAASSNGAYTVVVNGTAYHVEVGPAKAGAAPAVTSVTRAAAPATAPAAAAPAPVAAPATPAAPAGTASGTEVRTPLPGTVLRVAASAGQPIKRGDDLIVIESMKMEQPIKAPNDGVVVEICVAAGDTVESDQIVAII
ncbi:MAG: biotin attachment protein [Lentisphaerae bacterium]|nr:biotin attachment protein [Lentisphaerota bacterium]